jgi:hypothetical protein
MSIRGFYDGTRFIPQTNKLDKLLTKIRESRFSSGLSCLHCEGTAV